MTSGAVAVVGEQLDSVVDSWQHSKRSIVDMKFSPNGQSLAVASHDCNIYLYSVDIPGGKYTRRAVCSGHSSVVTHLDWSADSQFLQSNSQDYELLFWQASGNIFRSASKLRDVQWATWTATLGWPVQGASLSWLVWKSTDAAADSKLDCRHLACGRRRHGRERRGPRPQAGGAGHGGRRGAHQALQVLT
jgi:WD40 repeat protein